MSAMLTKSSSQKYNVNNFKIIYVNIADTY